MKTYLEFSLAERRFFGNQRQQFNAMNLAINNAVSLIVEQNGLEGQWTMNEDWTGLRRIDTPQEPNTEVVQGPAEARVESTSRERRANGKPL